MESLTTFIKNALAFVEVNIFKIILVIVLVIIFAFSFYLTAKSLKKLKPEILSYYPFDRFFPQSSGWSIGYFLIIILFLALLLIFLVRGEFYLRPS